MFLVDTAKGQPVATPDLVATFLRWAPDRNHLAGQWYGGPPSFWLWDRASGQFLLRSSDGLPGAHQFFEAWGSSGGTIAWFSAWPDGEFPYESAQGHPFLYRLGVESGAYTRVADEAGLAVESSRLIYVRLGSRLSLVVADPNTGDVLWTDDLGSPPSDGRPILDYRPQAVGRFVLYRTAGDEWRVSEVHRRNVKTLYRGRLRSAALAPDGQYVALLGDDRLLVVRNPLWH